MGLFSSTAKTPQRKNIFISYRVNDTAGETGRLVDSLKQYFYEDQIFVDIDKIEPGVDFTEAIAKSLECCDVMLAIIGPNWQGTSATSGSSRINNPNDWVRLEISTALHRNIRVVPVLVDGAELPTAEQLPDDLQPLLRRQAYEISNKRWKYDTEQLIRFLIKSVGIPTKEQTVTYAQPQKSWWAQNYPWVIVATGLFILIGGLLANNSNNNTSQQKEPVYNNEIRPQNKSIPTETTTAEPQKEYDINGTWYDANGLYYLLISQKGNLLSINSYSMAGLQTGQGTGTINNDDVVLNVNVANFGLISINAIFSKNGQNLNGTTKVENNGATYTEPLHLIKRVN